MLLSYRHCLGRAVNQDMVLVRHVPLGSRRSS
jgi:hypothetical protein